MSAMNKEMKFAKQTTTKCNHIKYDPSGKRLEYKTVYIIGAVDGSIPHDFALESYRNGDTAPLEEERRLFYVAVTRAKKELFISVPQNCAERQKSHP